MVEAVSTITYGYYGLLKLKTINRTMWRERSKNLLKMF
jgi:hypothetical protein